MLPEPIQMVLSIRDFEGQQKQGDEVQEEAGDVADPRIEPGELLSTFDPPVGTATRRRTEE